MMWSFIKSKTFSFETKEIYDESKAGLLSKTSRTEQKFGIFRVHTTFAMLHALMAIISISTFWTFTSLCRQNLETLRPLELPGVAEAIEYETIIFKISGGGTREDPVTPYEGPPTPEKDMRWYKLMDVGMISLTPEMNSTLHHPTQPASLEDNTPLIQLDVFHQLHCLNAIRNIVYGTNPWYDPDDRQDQIHVDHCLDYLRQVIMCHSDVTPIIHKRRRPGFNPLLSDWVPNFATPHTCRNFDKIHDWAKKYNTSGFVIESWPGLDPVAELRATENENKVI